MTPETLRLIMPLAGKRADLFAKPLTDTMDEFHIDTAKRQAAFLAQIGHESGSLVYVREIASGEAYDTGELAEKLGNTPEADGDGQKYKGRGLIQITGLNNYTNLTHAFGVDFINQPELLEEPVNASRSAGWLWAREGLNAYADADKFGTITKLINGGYNGIDDRIAFWLRARKALEVT